MSWTYADWLTFEETAAVVAVDTAEQTFTVAGDLRSEAQPGTKMDLEGSTGNDGTYTISSTTYTAAGTDQTVIKVKSAFTDATADGTITFAQSQKTRLERLRLHIEEVSCEVRASVTTDNTSYSAGELRQYLAELMETEKALNPKRRKLNRGRLWRQNG